MWEFEIGKNMRLFRTTAEQAQQPRRDTFEQDRLADDQRDCHERIDFHVAQVHVLQPAREVMENEEEVARDQHGIDAQLKEERAQRPGGFNFHAGTGRRITLSSLLAALPVARKLLSRRKFIAREGFLPTFHFAFTGDLWPTRQINIQKTSTENFTSTINASTAISVGRRHPRIINATTTADTPSFTSNPSRPKKRPFARKRWKVAPSKPSVTTALSGVVTGLWPVSLHNHAGELRSPSRPHHCRFRQQRRRRNSSGPENF